MFVMLAPVRGNVIAVRAEGKLTDGDYKSFLPTVEAVIKEHGKARLLIDMTLFEDWDWRAAWDDLIFELKHWRQLERVAVISESEHADWASKLADFLTGEDTKFFGPDESDAAWKWIEG